MENRKKVSFTDEIDEQFIKMVLDELSQGDYSCWDSGCRLAPPRVDVDSFEDKCIL